ncbi:50S ribosomal protein L6, partial [Mycoplasmopsis pullorum]
MSRVGNRVLTIPAGTTITVDGTKVTVKGKLGTLERVFSPK